MSSNAENGTVSSDVGVNCTKKKKRSNEATMKEELHQFSAVAQSANKMLTHLVSKQKGTALDDKDWDFCKHMYNKMEIPDGYVKDDLQVEIQQLITKAKKLYFNPPIQPLNIPTGYYQGNNETNFDTRYAASQYFVQPTVSQAQGSSVPPASHGSCQELLNSACNQYTQL